MTSAPQLPSQLAYSTDLQFYVDELRAMYNGQRMQTPDGYEVAFYLNRDYDCEHVICGKGKKTVDYGRAMRIPYIGHILMHDSTRVVRANKRSRQVCFVSRASSCVVICSTVRDKELKFITLIYDRRKNQSYLDKFDNRYDYHFL